MSNSLELRPILKRVGAYLIDLIILWIFGVLITAIPFINVNHDKYKEISKNYREEYNKYSELITLLNKAYDDEIISIEEYDSIKLLWDIPELDNIEEEKKLTKEEYDKIITDITENYEKIFNDYQYMSLKYSYSSSIVVLILQLLYFGVLQYFLNGQTIGKKILRVRVVSANLKKIGILNFIFRSLIVNDILFNAINVVFLIFASKEVYLQADYILNILVTVMETLIIFLVISRNDQRGIHDLMFNTKVVLESKKKMS